MGETSLQLQPDSVFVEGDAIENQLSIWAGVLKPPSHPECLVAEDMQKLTLASQFRDSGDGVSNATEAHTLPPVTAGASLS